MVASNEGREVSKMDEGDQKVQTFSYEINKLCDVQQGDHS